MTSRSRRRAGVAVAFILNALSVAGGGGDHIALTARAATPSAATGRPCDATGLFKLKLNNRRSGELRLPVDDKKVHRSRAVRAHIGPIRMRP